MSMITSSEIKRTNRNNIFQYIYHEKETSKQQIAEALNLSLPTVSQNVRELEELNLVNMDGFFEPSSSGGRKARIIKCNPVSRIAVGVEVLKEQSYIIAVNLYGDTIASDLLQVPLQNNELYFSTLGYWINNFIAELNLPADSLLSIGVSVQGLLSADNSTILYGELIGCTGLAKEQLGKYIKYPFTLIHDVDAAAHTEIWLREDIDASLFLWLNHNFGSVLVINGEIFGGAGTLTGNIEHMCLIPGGNPCYCGQSGCVETYCSVDALLAGTEDKDAAAFFSALREKDPKRTKAWHNYLHYLAMTLHNTISVLDCRVILGGLLRPHLQQEDLDLLTRYYKELCPFPFYKLRVELSKSNEFAAAIGAALYQIKDFFDHDKIFS